MTSDPVEYVMVGGTDLEGLATFVPALVELVQTARIRILDLVVLVRDRDGAVVVRDRETVDGLAPLRPPVTRVPGLLSDRDIALASIALRPGTASLVLVIEDSWAEPLSAAARRAGGRIVGGERIPPLRVKEAMRNGVGMHGRPRADLLARPPCPQRDVADGLPVPIVDPVDQLERLADLRDRGWLTREEFERQKAKVWGAG